MKILPGVFIMSLLPLAGCQHSLILVNVNSITHQASSFGTPALAPEVMCAALANPKMQVDGASVGAVAICDQAVAEQKVIDSAGKKR